MGEKIRDLAVGVAIRLSELDPSTSSYGTHADVWARQKNILSDCISRFQDKGCGQPDLPTGFNLDWAVDMAQAPAPGTSSFQAFIDRGGLEFLGLLLGPTFILAPGEVELLTYFLSKFGVCPLCDGLGADPRVGDLGL
jgi:hypothetical protein